MVHTLGRDLLERGRTKVLAQDMTIRIVARSGREEERTVRPDNVLLDIDEWNGEEIVGMYIGDTPLQNWAKQSYVSGSNPLKKSDKFQVIVADAVICETLRKKERKRMAEEKKEKPKPGMLVEDATVVAGTDKKTGETVVKPKTVEGKADESVEPTDKREKK